MFDVVSLDEKPKTNEAIQYRFATESLYYPLKITRTESGETSVELLILTTRLLSRFPGIPIERVRLMHEPVTITSQELRHLSEEMADMFCDRERMKLRIWRIAGTLASFDDDLIAE